eukprot:COSAG03_NODE_22556_length_289_cov_1.368421_2_plen_35_part_01
MLEKRYRAAVVITELDTQGIRPYALCVRSIPDECY